MERSHSQPTERGLVKIHDLTLLEFSSPTCLSQWAEPTWKPVDKAVLDASIQGSLLAHRAGRRRAKCRSSRAHGEEPAWRRFQTFVPCVVQKYLLWRDILKTLLVNLERSFGLGTDRKSNAETWGVALEHGDPSSLSFQSGNSGR